MAQKNEDDFDERLEAAATERGAKTREGLCLNEKTGELTDAMSWELENGG